MSNHALNFLTFSVSGVDAEKFLQGQLTLDLARLQQDIPKPAAICDLKGRIAFGFWISKTAADHFQIVIAADLADTLQAHIKKYAAFSKLSTSPLTAIFPIVNQNVATFGEQIDATDAQSWQQCAIRLGDYWITTATAGLFQPQELRLHQRGGVDYDKGCYLGQEIVARLWFRASPKAWLHRVQGQGIAPQAGESIGNGQIHIVNSMNTDDGWEGLVVAKPDDLSKSELTVLELPDGLNGSVARE